MWRSTKYTQAERQDRGLSEEYGRELSKAEGIEITYYETGETGYCAEVAKLATAPLDARVRALLSVIRSTPP